MAEKPKVFVIMPFSDDYYESYEMLKVHFGDIFEFSHAGDEDNQQNILADIIQPIYNADVIIADLSNLNPNVMYELGIAHAFNKKTVIITRDELNKLPFDLKQYRAKDYSVHFVKFNQLLNYLDIQLKGAVDGSTIFSNPVSDFLNRNGLNPNCLFSTEPISIDVDETEKGFVDFLADIEAHSAKMKDRIEDLASEMDVLKSSLDTAAGEINRVNKNGGDGTASFAKKQAKKIAEKLDTFGNQLQKQVMEISFSWDEIEKNTLGLLENKYASKDDNNDSIKQYLKSLYELKTSIFTSNISIETMKQSFLGGLGLQKNLNHSLKSVDEKLAEYLTLTGRMITSIDRIIDKSRFIVGKIDFIQDARN